MQDRTEERDHEDREDARQLNNRLEYLERAGYSVERKASEAALIRQEFAERDASKKLRRAFQDMDDKGRSAAIHDTVGKLNTLVAMAQADGMRIDLSFAANGNMLTAKVLRVIRP